MAKQGWFKILLDDYSAPAFITATKSYYGTVNDVAKFIDSLRINEVHKHDYKDTIIAFDSFLAGNMNAMHTISYTESKILNPVEVFYKEEHKVESFEWEHKNVWDCAYLMRLDAAETQHLWIKDEDKYYRILKAKIEGLYYKGLKGEWIPLEDNFWGFPGLIVSEGNFLCNQLACIEKTFDSFNELQNDHVAYQTKHDVNFEGFCDDIFGNG